MAYSRGRCGIKEQRLKSMKTGQGKVMNPRGGMFARRCGLRQYEKSVI
jgi:hypothetical protein